MSTPIKLHTISHHKPHPMFILSVSEKLYPRNYRNVCRDLTISFVYEIAHLRGFSRTVSFVGSESAVFIHFGAISL